MEWWKSTYRVGYGEHNRLIIPRIRRSNDPFPVWIGTTEHLAPVKIYQTWYTRQSGLYTDDSYNKMYATRQDRQHLCLYVGSFPWIWIWESSEPVDEPLCEIDKVRLYLPDWIEIL